MPLPYSFTLSFSSVDFIVYTCTSVYVRITYSTTLYKMLHYFTSVCLCVCKHVCQLEYLINDMYELHEIFCTC